jgi:arylsulfatase
MLFNLRADPFERATESVSYDHWRMERIFALVPAQAYVVRFLESFKDFPPRQRPGSFSLGDAMERLRRGSAN